MSRFFLGKFRHFWWRRDAPFEGVFRPHNIEVFQDNSYGQTRIYETSFRSLLAAPGGALATSGYRLQLAMCYALWSVRDRTIEKAEKRQLEDERYMCKLNLVLGRRFFHVLFTGTRRRDNFAYVAVLTYKNPRDFSIRKQSYHNN